MMIPNYTLSDIQAIIKDAFNKGLLTDADFKELVGSLTLSREYMDAMRVFHLLTCPYSHDGTTCRFEQEELMENPWHKNYHRRILQVCDTFLDGFKMSKEDFINRVMRGLQTDSPIQDFIDFLRIRDQLPKLHRFYNNYLQILNRVTSSEQLPSPLEHPYSDEEL